MSLQKTGQSSLTDFLVRIMPSLIPNMSGFNPLENEAAKNLFKLWRSEESKIADKLYNKPVTVGKNEIDMMSKAGFVRQIGSNIQITPKGSEVIRVMILGDDSSIFDGESNITYAQALSKIEATASTGNRMSKNAENQWWSRFE